MHEWQNDGRTLHIFVGELGFGIVVPLRPDEAARDDLTDRLQNFGPELAEHIADLCAYATAFQECAPSATVKIEGQLYLTAKSLEHSAIDASALCGRLRKGLE